jgi:hypothetical protein
VGSNGDGKYDRYWHFSELPVTFQRSVVDGRAGIALKSPPDTEPNKKQPEAITPVIAMRNLGYARIVSKAMVEQME